jgi:hypothetical protein
MSKAGCFENGDLAGKGRSNVLGLGHLPDVGITRNESADWQKLAAGLLGRLCPAQAATPERRSEPG